MKKTFVAGLASLAVMTAAHAVPPAPPSPIGDWIVEDKNGHIRVVQCQDALWGVISWTNETGTDENNADPAKRSRPLVGVPILLGMKSTKPNRWDGEVYNAVDGKQYTAHITLTSADVLKIDGCVLGGLVCGGEEWTRISSPEKGGPQQTEICSSVPK